MDRDCMDANKAPAVSIIIAAYNVASYIESAIESALAQKEVDVEIVMVDDASTDNTAEVGLRYEKKGLIRLLRNSTNMGPSYSRNRAIQAARGEWIAQLDGDDWFSPDRLAVLLEAAVSNQADLVADDLFLVENSTLCAVSTRFLDNKVPWTQSKFITLEDLIKYDLGSMKPLMRRSFLLEHKLAYREDLSFGEDFLFLYKALLGGARVLLIPQPLYHLRRGNTGSLTTHWQRFFEQLETSAVYLINEDAIQKDSAIILALKKRILNIRRYAALEEIIRWIKRGNIIIAAKLILKTPGLLNVLLLRVPTSISKRLRRMRCRNLLKKAHQPPSARC